MNRVYSDRSRIEAYQRCARLRFLEYHQNGIGITSARKPLPLAVGGAVHAGLEVLLREGSKIATPLSFGSGPSAWDIVEEAAVCGALQDFKQFATALQVDTAEGQVVPEAQSAFDEYLFKEQSALVEALVRAYARRRLRPLLEQFEVLEIEREGEWKLADWISDESETSNPERWGDDNEVWFMSRPDALLLERQSQQLYLLSFKTASGWDVRKERDAQHDMQGLSEGIEIERRLGNAWEALHKPMALDRPEVTVEICKAYNLNTATANYVMNLDSPPRILAVRYEYLLKGERWRDKDLSARLGFDARSQRSPLVRGYMNTASPAGHYGSGSEWNCSWDYLKPDGTGETSKLNYRQWRSEPIWEHMTIKEWIDRLADSAPCQSGDTGQELGIKSNAQTTGYLTKDPLDEVFIPPVVVYRNEDDLRDLVEQMEAQERRVAENVALVNTAGDEGERRSLLNQHFPQTRRACEYPTTCAMSKVCYGGEDIRKDPLGSGLYQLRVPNHPQEVPR